MSAAGSGPAPGFHRRTLTILVVVGAVSLAVAFGVSLLGVEPEEPAFGTGARSESALGYDAFLVWLETLDGAAVVSRGGTAGKAGPESAVFLLEPRHPRTAAAHVEAVQESGGRVVLVLPKWQAGPHPDRPGWVGAADLLPASVPREILDAVSDPATPSRLARPRGWSAEGRIAVGTTPDPALPRPQLAGEAPGFTTLLGTGDGGLILEDGYGLIVITDPDLFNNAGLGREGNAEIVLWFLDEILGTRRVVVDAGVHGGERPATIWAELLEYPLLLVTLHCLGLLFLAVWAAQGRFGKPEPLPPRIAPGKEGLIENTVRLLTAAGHGGDSLRRYWRFSLQEAARRSGIAPERSPEELIRLLGAAGRRRGIAPDPAELDAAVGEIPMRGGTGTLSAARRIYAWRRRMTGDQTEEASWT